jgi:6-phosphofructokinase 2
MEDVLTITLNPAVDISTSVDRIEPVRKLRCRAEVRSAGGGGVNVARVVNRLGGNVTAIFTAGGVVGEQLKQLVASESVPSHALAVAGQTRESFTVVDETTKNEFRFVMPGPTLTEVEWRTCEEQVENLAKGRKYIVVSGSLPSGAPADLHTRLAALAKRAGARFVVDASGLQLKAALEAGVYLAKPNLRELQEIVAEDLGDRSSQVQACRRLIESGKAQIVALTLGSAGALLVTRDEAWFSDPLPVKVVGTVGAGDSFLGAMVWSLSAGHSLESTLRFAVAAGSAALLSQGTQLSRPEDVHTLAPQVSLHRL